MKLSVFRSTFAVASSRTSILVRSSMARARQMSYFWPTDKRLLFSVMSVRRPFFSSFSTISSSFTSLRIYHISSSLFCLKGSKLSRRVPYNRKGYWGINAILCRSMWSPISFMFCPSISTEPSLISHRRKRICKIELFPAPVLPTIPTFMPGCIVKLKFSIDGGRFSRYLIVTSLNSIPPRIGQSFLCKTGLLMLASRWSLI